MCVRFIVRFNHAGNREMSRKMDALWLVGLYIVIVISCVLSWPNTRCPLTCSCDHNWDDASESHRKFVDCYHGNLVEIPVSVPRDTEVLSLADNDLSSTGRLRQLESLAELKCLNLSGNRIGIVGDLRKLSSELISLDISRNRIAYLPGDWLPQRKGMHYLNVSRNRIDVIHTKSFNNMSNLVTLDLSANILWELSADWFTGLINLESLYLMDNKLSTLTENSFKPLGNLNHLDVSGNRIRQIEIGAFSGLLSLLFLKLNDNELKSVPTKELQKFSRIDLIDLSANRFPYLYAGDFDLLRTSFLYLQRFTALKFISKSTFRHLHDLKCLKVNFNPELEYLDPLAFQNLTNLKELYLNNNRLKVIPQSIVDSVPSLTSLYIRENPLYCNCSIHWLEDGSVNKSHAPISSSIVMDRNESVCLSTINGSTSGVFNLLNETSVPRPRATSHCTPIIISSLNPSVIYYVGDELNVYCYAVGYPAPRIQWMRSNKQCKNESQTTKNGMLLQTGINLNIVEIAPSDSGVYKCRATNEIGTAEQCFSVIVKSNNAKVVVLRRSDSSLVITWVRTITKHQYKIFYKENSDNSTYDRVFIRSGMKEYVLGQLNSSTEYLICITMLKDKQDKYKNCITVSTISYDPHNTGIYSIRNLVIGLVVGSVILIISGIIVIWYFIDRYNKAKSRPSSYFPQSTSQQAFFSSRDDVSDTTPIAYENRILDLSDEDENIIIGDSFSSTSPV